MRIQLLTIITLFITISISAQSKKAKFVSAKTETSTTPTHQEIFSAKMDMPIQATLTKSVVEFGKSFLNSVYPKSHISPKKIVNGKVKLQPISEEVLAINLRLFDCVTFAENMIALAETQHSGNPDYDVFKEKLRNIRYRDGAVDYAARLHYFSDWLFENEKRGILKQVTKELGGEPYLKKVYFMSRKKDTIYGNMADPYTYKTVQKVEKDITAREKIYIPKDKVAAMQHLLKEGDIIGITNKTEGMDMAHVGIVVLVNGKTHLMHASSQYKKVMITEDTLSEYLLGNKIQTGIMVGRLVD
jgi:Protein of unknown function (DUF1460)